uniref:Uncharacterized protein n=1 Tax=Eutreptiella gymnastica TaxID=73025 RepID=A0A7S1HV74_9EUGL|mmetsp:Transcript_108266/g.187005  ORF Transcript_108266/g.187005 Transcript_108266/m.187005 type:complete len:107 (+) Transcript_108266:518-838(+)
MKPPAAGSHIPTFRPQPKASKGPDTGLCPIPASQPCPAQMNVVHVLTPTCNQCTWTYQTLSVVRNNRTTGGNSGAADNATMDRATDDSHASLNLLSELAPWYLPWG